MLEKSSTATSYVEHQEQVYPINLGTENLFNPSVAINNCTVNNGEITITANTADTYIKGQYVYSDSNKFLTLDSGSYYLKSTNSNVRVTLYGNNGNIDTDGTQPKIMSSETNFGGIRIRSVDGTSLQNVSFKIMLSTKDSSYYPYGITPIELCKIGDYQDYLYKENNKWYSTNLFTKINSYNGETITTTYISTTGGLDTGATVYYYNGGNNPLEITDSTLISQLDNIEYAMSYKEQTNISQENNDMPFIIPASAFKDLSNL